MPNQDAQTIPRQFSVGMDSKPKSTSKDLSKGFKPTKPEGISRPANIFIPAPPKPKK